MAEPALPAAPPATPGPRLLALYAGTLFASAALLFSVQPLVAKMLLPSLGGAAAVWTACMLFFQATLLAGYAYAHAVACWVRPRWQVVLQLILLLAGGLCLPIALPEGWEPPPVANPSAAVLGLLALVVGLPFFTLSTSAPLLQSWFTRTGHAAAHDPYPLYAASNAGSLLALLAYPVLIEPGLALPQQSLLWLGGYVILAILTLACGLTVWRCAAAVPGPAAAAAEVIDWRRRAQWVLLALVPSSLMVGITAYLTIEIAAIPLFWVIPLAVYLLTFIVSFGAWPAPLHRTIVLVLPLAVLVQGMTLWQGTWLFVLFPVQLGGFALIGLAYHGELARRRPSARHVTEFYLWLSLGGVLGSLFNALVAPLLFNELIEYPLMLAAALLLMPLLFESARRRWLRWLHTAAATAVGIALLAYIYASLVLQPLHTVIHRDRSFYSILQVNLSPQKNTHMLLHGRILHSAQFVGPDPRLRRIPLLYFFPSGPIGQLFQETRRQGWPDVAVFGLGAGTLATYAQPGHGMTFFEIDPAVERVARDQRLFTYLSDAEERGVRLRVVIGDARRSLRDQAGAAYDMIVLDAFSGDGLPVHLLTREALQLYLTRLKPDGVIVVNLSNKYVDLDRVVRRLAADAGLVGVIREDLRIRDEEVERGHRHAMWGVLARRPEDLGPLLGDPRWQVLMAQTGDPLWTDEYSNLLEILRRE